MRHLAISALLATTSSALADPVWAVRPEPGLVCMTVVSNGVQIVEHPLENAASLATAGSIVFAVKPQHVSDGYIEVERPNRQIGWIPQSAVTGGPPACAATLMSNGLILAQ